ncbi:MAG: globin family protein [Pseudomonadota bacterium]
MVHPRPAPPPNPAEIALVVESFHRILPISRLAGELFYARLFADAPHLQPLFKGDMDRQGEKLMQVLGVIVAGLAEPERILAEARDLAARHVTYGVTPAHYAPVGEALIWTLAQGLGERFTPEIRAAWETTYAWIAETMVSAAYPRAGQTGIAAE